MSETTETLTDDQVVGFCILLMFAGNETTTNLLGNLLNRLAGAPDGWAALRADPTRIEGAIEESLRVDSPAQMLMRVATQDVAIGGDRHARPARWCWSTSLSANRDPGPLGQTPANFELSRDHRPPRRVRPRRPHSASGAPLARMEAKAAMDAAGRPVRQPGKRFPAGPAGSGGGLLFGFRSLPVVLN